MRTATAETRRALRRAIGSVPYSRWAKENGLHPATVHAALKGYPMKARRENLIRAVLELEPVETKTVEIISGKQYIATRTPPRETVRRAITLKPDEAAELDKYVSQHGYRSFNAFWHDRFKRKLCSSGLEQG